MGVAKGGVADVVHGKFSLKSSDISTLPHDNDESCDTSAVFFSFCELIV
jgi:hypothetical protein